MQDLSVELGSARRHVDINRAKRRILRELDRRPHSRFPPYRRRS